MAPKRFKKGDTDENSEKYKKLSLSEVLCPICRNILIEPVTLPCSHGFCLSCFNGTMENTTLTCPLCRTRIGSWLRSARKENKMINNVLWSIMQIKFSNEIDKKLQGDDITTEEKVQVRLANPGEIRREYEKQLQQERSEIQKQRETEAKASEIVIKKILEEEQKAVQIEQEKLRLDEEVARRLTAEQQRAGPSSTSSSHSSTTSQKSAKKSSIERYLIALGKKKQDNESNKPKIDKVKISNKIVNKSKVNDVSATKPEIVAPVKPNSSILCQKVASKQQCSKSYKHLLLTRTLHCERSNSNDSDSGDSIKQEMRYFKPIRIPPSSDILSGTASPLIKIPPLVAQSASSVIIRSPQRNLLVRIGTHPGSAFVSCSPEIQKPVMKIKQPSIVTDSGKIIKQYYNKKVNTLYSSCTVTSPVTSPCLGFETPCKQNYLTKMHDIITNLAEHVDCRSNSVNFLSEIPRSILPETRTSKRISISKRNINLSPGKVVELSPKKIIEISPKKDVTYSPKKILEMTPKKVVHISPKKIFELTSHKKLDLSPKKINGCVVQEKLDLEFARRLHEELNNPRNRQTRASNQPKKPAMKTRTSPRKRQIRLDELITPKKFKT